MPICCYENSVTVLPMSNVACLNLTVNLMYCSSMWFYSTVTSMKKLKIAYNNGLRWLLNIPKYISASEMFVNLNIPSFNEFVRKLVFSIKTRILKSDNSLVNGIVTSTILLLSSIWAWWSDILDTYP